MKPLVKQPGQPLEILDESKTTEFQIGTYYRSSNGRWLRHRDTTRLNLPSFLVWEPVKDLPKEIYVELLLLNPD
jgi:hypothetical protein